MTDPQPPQTSQALNLGTMASLVAMLSQFVAGGIRHVL